VLTTLQTVFPRQTVMLSRWNSNWGDRDSPATLATNVRSFSALSTHHLAPFTLCVRDSRGCCIQDTALC